MADVKVQVQGDNLVVTLANLKECQAERSVSSSFKSLNWANTRQVVTLPDGTIINVSLSVGEKNPDMWGDLARRHGM